MSEWQPIETAPKEGTIDLWNATGRWTDCYWNAYHKRFEQYGFGRSEVVSPTHWMPLPKPPASTGAGGVG